MAEFLGMQYVTIMIAAAIPAILYYVAEYAVVHIEAKKMGMRPIPREEIIPLSKVLKERGHLMVPMVAIVSS